MAEDFGSAKSSSSVSEPPSSSSESTPSSGGSSTTPSSSSDDGHTCVKCGECCLSDKSWAEIVTKPVIDPADVTDYGLSDLNTKATDTWNALDVSHVNLDPDSACTFRAYSPSFTANGQLYRLVVRIKFGSGGTLSVGVDGSSDGGATWGAAYGFLSPVSVTTSTCCTREQTMSFFFGNKVKSYTMAAEVRNNPCCRDTNAGNECADHFDGGCKGDCDETIPSSSSSSEGNPFP